MGVILDKIYELRNRENTLNKLWIAELEAIRNAHKPTCTHEGECFLDLKDPKFHTLNMLSREILTIKEEVLEFRRKIHKDQPGYIEELEKHFLTDPHLINLRELANNE